MSNRIMVASTRRNSGKTSSVIGLAIASKQSCGYMKPFGDRLLYKKKRLWDYDAALVTAVLNLKENPEDMSIGFEHAKLKFMYDENTIKQKLEEVAKRASEGKQNLFIEGPSDLIHGISVRLDFDSVAKTLGAKLLVVASGPEDTILDDLVFLKKHIGSTTPLNVLINKIHDVEGFKNNHLKAIEGMGLRVIGVVPYTPDLAHFTVSYLADVLFAKVLAGEAGMQNRIKSVLVGAMTVGESLSKILKSREDKLIITSGDRSDIILAAVESKASGIVLTNNILPPSNIISIAASKNVPVLLVSTDTFQTAKLVDDMEPLVTKDEVQKIDMIAKLFGGQVDYKALME